MNSDRTEAAQAAALLKEFQKQGKFVPSQYMRRLRPEQFSDSNVESTPTLDKQYFEILLETLTNRKLEQTFEDFSRRLCELEVCPNLKPQTGSTGGGDSKTDSSTYPVSSVLVDRTYWGSPSPPSSERWAFAFSCMKQWKRKAKSDVQKIAELKLGFTKAYFVTNQFARDKDRAALEQELSAQCGLEVHILDKSWLMGRVFDHKRESVAIATLNIPVTNVSRSRVGPRDLVSQRELDDELAKLRSPMEHYRSDYLLASAYRRAALLARSLDRPRHEVEGLFSRARALSATVGDIQQQLSIGYDAAWTLHWFYDAAIELELIYRELESFLPQLHDVDQLVLLRNLLHVIVAAARSGAISPDTANLQTRFKTLHKQLSMLSEDPIRVNNALHAEFVLHLSKLILACARLQVSKTSISSKKLFAQLFPNPKASTEESCAKLADLFDRVEGLLTFPFQRIVHEIEAVAEVVSVDLPGMDALYEVIARETRAREGDSHEGQVWLARGLQLFNQGREKDALLALGKARTRLAKEESLEGAMRAALGACDAYMTMGLYWAARIEALIVVHTTLRMVDGELFQPAFALQALHRLCGCDTRLDRIGPLMCWLQLFEIVAKRMLADGADREHIMEGAIILQVEIGSTFLRMNEAGAKRYRPLERHLEQMGFGLLAYAIQYAAGEKDAASSSYSDTAGIPLSKSRELLDAWQRKESTFLVRSSTEKAFERLAMKTEMMGVTYSIKCDQTFGQVLLCENIIGVIEAMLALARWEYLAFVVDEVKLDVFEGPTGSTPPQIRRPNQFPIDSYTLEFAPNLEQVLLNGDRKAIAEWFHEMVLRIVFDSTIDPLDDLMEELHKWGEDGTFERALSTTPTAVVVADLLDREKYDETYWIRSPTASKI